MKKYNISRYVIVILIIVIAVLLYNDEKEPNFWVDNIKFHGYIYNDNGVEVPKASLSFDLISDKPHDLVIKRTLFSSSTKSNTMDFNTNVYFKCHNKMNDDFYLIDVFDYENGLHLGVDKDGPKLNSNPNNGYNYYEIKNQTIIDNAMDIDYCTFLSIIRK